MMKLGERLCRPDVLLFLCGSAWALSMFLTASPSGEDDPGDVRRGPGEVTASSVRTALLAVWDGTLVGMLGAVMYVLRHSISDVSARVLRRLHLLPAIKEEAMVPSTLDEPLADKAPATAAPTLAGTSAATAESPEREDLSSQRDRASQDEINAFGDALAALRSRGAPPKSPPRSPLPTPTSGRVAAAMNSNAVAALLSGALEAARVTDAEGWQRSPVGSRTTDGDPQQELQRPRATELLRSVQRLLNKVCPENVCTIVEQLADIEVRGRHELAFVIATIFKRALLDPHYGETYADLAFGLHAAWPETPASEGSEAPATFLPLLVDTCRKEFAALPSSFEPTAEERAQEDAEEIEFRMKKKKDRMLAFMRLVGNLFLRGLFSASAIGAILADLLRLPKDSAPGQEETLPLPGEHEVECACELLRTTGATLQADPDGDQAISRACKQLRKLREAKDAEGKGAYSKRLQFMVQDLVDLRMSGWLKKAFQSNAKTRDAIRQDAACEEELRQHGEDGILEVVAGARPQTIAGTKVQWGDADLPQASSDVNQDKLKAILQRDKKLSQTKKILSSEWTPGGLVLTLPPGGAGKIIGHGGGTIQILQAETGAHIWIDCDNNRAHISGTPPAVFAAERGISFIMQDSTKGVSKRKGTLAWRDKEAQSTTSTNSGASDASDQEYCSDWSSTGDTSCTALLDVHGSWQDDNGCTYKVQAAADMSWIVTHKTTSTLVFYSEADGVFWWGQEKAFYMHPREMYSSYGQLTWYRRDDWEMQWPSSTWHRLSGASKATSGGRKKERASEAMVGRRTPPWAKAW